MYTLSSFEKLFGLYNPQGFKTGLFYGPKGAIKLNYFLVTNQNNIITFPLINNVTNSRI